MNYPYIDEIVSQLQDSTFSVFCGAGASMDATHTSWEMLFHKTTQEFYNNKFNDDVYFLADLESSYYNSDNFLGDIKEKLARSASMESQHINAITDLNINQIWTTNFDEIIENTIRRKLGIEPTVIKDTEDLFTCNLNGPFTVYKLNGSIGHGQSMVLTKSDFFAYFKEQRLVFELLKRQLVLDSFLFVGYSFKDDLVLNALREIKDVFPEKGKQHYRFVRIKNPKEEDIRRSRAAYDRYESQYFEDKYNIKTIFIDEQTEIDTYLRELYCRYCNHNVFICGSFRNITNDERLYIEEFVDALVVELFKNRFNIYSGNGRGLGEIVVARTSKYQQVLNGHVVNRPLIFTGDSEQKKRLKNKRILKDCSTMIIICGQDDSLQDSKNVYAQFGQFMANFTDEAAPLVIPVPTTGYAAKSIYHSEDFRNTYSYRNNQAFFQRIEQEDEPKSIAKLIANCILTYRKEPNS